ncbi:MAG: hypothetical protein ABI870_12015 [Rhodanobacter sp.]
MMGRRPSQHEVVAITGPSKTPGALTVLFDQQILVGECTGIPQDQHERKGLRQRLVAGPPNVPPQCGMHSVDGDDTECVASRPSGIEFTHGVDIVKHHLGGDIS